MFVKETKNHDYSLQCVDYQEVRNFLDMLKATKQPSLERLAVKLRDRVSDEYASGNVKYTILLFHDEVPVLLSHGLNISIKLEKKPKLFKRVLGVE